MGWADAPEVQAVAGPPKWATAPEVAPAVSKSEAAMRGAVEGATLGVLPKLARLGPQSANTEAQLDWGEEPSAAETRQAGEGYRQAQQVAQRAHPWAYGGAQAVGSTLPLALAASAAPVVKGAGLLPRVLTGASQGGTAGLASGLAGGENAQDVATSTGVGILGGAALPLVGAALRRAVDPLREFAGEQAGLARARAGVKAAQDVAEPLVSARGQLGAEVQKGSRYVENLMRLEESMTPEQRALYSELQASGVVPKLQQSIAQSTLERLPGQASTIAEKQAAFEALQSQAPEAVKARAAELLSPAEVKSQLKARAWRYGPPLIGSAIGSAMGGPLGTAVGFLAGAGSRPAVQSVRRMVKTPAVQNALWGGLERTLGNPPNVQTEALPALMAALRKLRPQVSPVPAAAEESQ